MDIPEICVADSHEIGRWGIAVMPVEGLPPRAFGLTVEVELLLPDGSRRTATGTVESMLISATSGDEVFTYRLTGVSLAEVPPGTKIRAAAGPVG